MRQQHSLTQELQRSCTSHPHPARLAEGGQDGEAAHTATLVNHKTDTKTLSLWALGSPLKPRCALATHTLACIAGPLLLPSCPVPTRTQLWAKPARQLHHWPCPRLCPHLGVALLHGHSQPPTSRCSWRPPWLGLRSEVQPCFLPSLKGRMGKASFVTLPGARPSPKFPGIQPRKTAYLEEYKDEKQLVDHTHAEPKPPVSYKDR